MAVQLASLPLRAADGLSHYRYIDALRGFAFLAVLTLHVGRDVKPFPGVGLTGPGQYGVQLFFLLSAITLCRSLNARKGSEQFAVRNFYLRRLFRIAPLFWCAMIFYTILYGVGPSHWAPTGLHAWHFFTTATFTHGLMPSSINSVVPGGWSIAVEMTFYLILPWLIRRVTGAASALTLAGVCVVGNVLLSMLLSHIFQSAGVDVQRGYVVGYFYFWFPSQAAVFLLGMATYYALESQRLMQFIRHGHRPTILLLFSACCTIFFSAAPSHALLPLHVLIPLALIPAILSLAARPNVVLVNRATQQLGKLSFSCYLVHFGALRLAMYVLETTSALPADPLAAAGLTWMATLGITIAIARLTFRYIESAGIAVGNHVIRYLEPLPVKALPAAQIHTGYRASKAA